MPYCEADLLPLSALQHLLYCERQCALIHLERVWQENRWTAEGQRLHKNAHAAPSSTRGTERSTRGMEVRSFELGIFGRCDIVLFQAPNDASLSEAGLSEASLGDSVSDTRPAGITRAWRRASPAARRNWIITPVEYKRGRPKKNACDRVQLCGQALCLEEMLGVSIAGGQIFYGQTRKRIDVPFDEELRRQTIAAAARLHELISSGLTPPAEYDKGKCGRCSLFEQCLPKLGRRSGVAGWFERQLMLEE